MLGTNLKKNFFVPCCDTVKERCKLDCFPSIDKFVNSNDKFG